MTQQLQMKKYPKLFCLFKRVLGFFLFVFIFSQYYGQVILKGDVFVFDPKAQTSRDASVYISEGSYVYNSTTPEKIKKYKQSINNKTSATIDVRRNNKKLAVRKEKTKPDHKAQYAIIANDDTQFSSSSSTTALFTNTADHYKKPLAVIIGWQSFVTFLLSRTKLFYKIIDKRYSYSTDYHRIRPPPDTHLL